MSLDQEWLQFLENEEIIKDFANTDTLKTDNSNTDSNTDSNNEEVIECENDDIPECDDLSISTNTKVLFLNQEIDINNVFWNIPISNYQKEGSCVIKKQIKIVNHSNDEYEEYKKKKRRRPFYKSLSPNLN